MIPSQWPKILIDLIADPWILLRILFLIAFLIYFAFAVVVVRQIDLMSRTLNDKLNFPLKVASLIHLLIALAAFVLAAII